MRHGAPIVVQRLITVCAPREVDTQMVTHSQIIAKGLTLTPTARCAVGCTIARGSMETVTVCAPLEDYPPKTLAVQLQQPGPLRQTLVRVHARPDRVGV